MSHPPTRDEAGSNVTTTAPEVRWGADRPWHRWAAGALLTLHGVLAWMGRAFGINTGNDDAVYVLLARSIRQLGYHDSYLVGTPVHSQYPPGFPALLAFLSLPFGERFDLFLAAIVLCSVAALAFLYDAIRRCHGSGVALTVLALCALNPELIWYGGQLMSESVYLLFTTVAIWAVLRDDDVDHAEPGTFSRWWLIAVGAAIAAALTRMIGVTMVGALILFWLSKRRYRRALLLATPGIVGVGGWLLWSILAPDKIVGRSYIADATFAGDKQSALEVLIGRATTNLSGYLTNSLPSIIPQPTLAGTILDNVVGLILILWMVGVGARVLWTRARIVVIYGGATVLLLTAWAWQLSRFLVPLLPFLLWMLVLGAIVLSRRRRWLGPLPVVVAALVLLTAMSRNQPLLRIAVECDRRAAKESPRCYTAAQRAFFAMARYIRDSTPDTAVFLTVKEGTLGYLTGRRMVRHEEMQAPTAEEMRVRLRDRTVDYVILTPLRAWHVQHVQALTQMCGDVEVVKAFEPVTYLLKVNAPGSANGDGRPDTCAALANYETASLGHPTTLTER